MEGSCDGVAGTEGDDDGVAPCELVPVDSCVEDGEGEPEREGVAA